MSQPPALHAGRPPLPIVVVLSGNGSNLQAIIDGIAQDLPVEIRAVISNRSDALGLERAKKAKIPTETINHKDYASRSDFDHALQQKIDHYKPELVVLAGFMRILTEEFVKHYKGRMLNVHPSLLPEFPGLNTHQRALDAEAQEHGSSVHFVTEDLDGGPVIIQAKIPLSPEDTAATLEKKVLVQEHIIYPIAIRWFAEGRLELQENHILLDGKTMSHPYLLLQ
jgi:phosphoribosylglycinamide formyltransferase-1